MPVCRYNGHIMKTTQCDFLVVGSGLAGLSFALKTANKAKVIIITKDKMDSTNSALAQGGIASVISKTDDFSLHIKDTLTAGAGLCKKDVVEMVVSEGPDRIQDLVNWGVQFDMDETDQGKFSLTREGGHSHRRILHVADHTGKAVHQQVLHQAKNHPNITILDETLAVDLITQKKYAPYSFGCDRALGCYVLNKKNSEVSAITAKATVLASGGAGKVYLFTSNWSGATGDGIAIAFRAGARVANMEFMQFHPTCLYHPQARNFLITEAIRGEGGELVNKYGHAFMKSYHPLGSLAPRDIVAQSIDAEMKKTGHECVFLDISHKEPDFLKQRFPQIYAKCLKHGIDISKSSIPVVPAAHYLCGGVMTGKNGQTDIPGLYAIGETACTGLHGANRLASNSLLECLVFAHNAATELLGEWDQLPEPILSPPEHLNHDKENADELIVISHMWEEVRRLMWNYVGIVRSDKRLLRAQHRIDNMKDEINEFYSKFKLHSDIVELRNIVINADLIVRCALQRKESRGIHYSLDHTSDRHHKSALDTIISPC